jgi:hypothetical protein
MHSYSEGSSGALSTLTARPLCLASRAVVLLLLLGALLAGLDPIPVWAQAEPACTPPPSGMVSWWGGDGNANDIIGTNHGTLVNGATYAPGMVGQAFNFNGVDDYVEIPDSTSLNPSGAFSVDGWFYIDPSASSNAGEIATLVAKTEGSTGNGWALYFDDRSGVGASKSLKFVLGTVLESKDAILTPNWYHIAGVFDPSATPNATLYINGAVVAAVDTSGATANALNVRIGAMYWTDTYEEGNDRLNGKADEVEIFNRALAAEEIAAIYNAGGAGKCRSCVIPPSDMVSWWDGEGDANDIIGTNHGTLQNGATFAPGMVGQAFSFDGVNDFVQVPDALSLNFAPTSPLTIYMWAYPTAGGDMHLIGKRATCWDAGASANYQIAQDSTHGLHFNSGGVLLSSGQQLLTNQWQHVAVTADGSMFRLYINGQEKVSVAGTLGAQDSGAPLIIGGVCLDVGATFPGLLDEVAIVSRALSAEEIAAIANAGSAGKCQSCVTPPSNMVSWWKGENNADDSIDGNNGTLVNDATYAPGMVGQAFSFNGAEDYVVVPPSSSFDFGTGDFAVDAWIYPKADTDQAIVSRWDNDLAWDLRLGWGIGVSDKLYFFFGDAPGSGILISDAVSLNQWHHVAVTRKDGILYGYLDGVEYNAGIQGGNASNSNARLAIGKHLGFGNPSFNGLIDEVEIFNHALEASEIAAIYNAGSAGKCQAADTTPDPFTFTDVTGVPLSTEQISNPITVSGITAPAAISIVGGEYEVNGSGTWTNIAGTVANGDTVKVRHTSAATSSTAVDTTLTIGGISDTFTSTTLAVPNGPDLTGDWNPVSQICRRDRCMLMGSVRVWNQGNATAPTARLRVIFSDDAVLDPGDTVLQESSIRSLRPGWSRTSRVRVRLPLGANASGKYLFAVMDALNSVAETDEANNEPMYGPIP